MAYDPHPFQPKWFWCAGEDDERHTVGPCTSKKEVIKTAIDDQIGAYTDDDVNWHCSFWVAELRDSQQDLAEWFNADMWLEDTRDYMDDNKCGGDEYGDNHPLDTITNRQIRELEASVRLAIRHWQRRNNLKLRSVYSPGKRNAEWIDVRIGVKK